LFSSPAAVCSLVRLVFNLLPSELVIMATSLNIDRLHAANHGELSSQQQSAGFVSDPFLTPVTHNTHPVSPDPSPSTDPALFDPSTSHPNNHYHPEKKLGKKKKAKKLGVGGGKDSTHSHPHTNNPVNTHNQSFTEHEKNAEERLRKEQEKREKQQEEEEEEEEEEEGEEGEAEGDETIDKTETIKPPNADKEYVNKSNISSDKSPSLLQKASEAATSVVSSATGVVNAALSKVGLHKEKSTTEEQDTTSTKERMDQQEDESSGSSSSTTSAKPSRKKSSSADKEKLSPNQKQQNSEEQPRKSSLGGMMSSATGMLKGVLGKVGIGGAKNQNSDDQNKEEPTKTEGTTEKEVE